MMSQSLRARKPLAQQFQTFQVLGSKEGYSAANRWWMGPLSQTWFLPLPFQLRGSLMICFNLELPCKMKWSVSCSAVSDSSWPHGLSPSGPSDRGIFQTRILEWVAIPFSTGILPTQGLNSRLLHCKKILYHPSHQGSPLLNKTS